MAYEPNQGPPQGDNPESTSSQPDFDYEAGYNSLRPEFTRTTQALSAAQAANQEYEALFEALNDPATQAEAMDALGFTVENDEPENDDEFVDPVEQDVQRLRAELEEIRSSQEAQTTAHEAEELTTMRDDYIGESIGYIEQSSGQEFSEREEEVLGNLAIAMEDEDGVPDVQGAYDAIYGEQGVLETRRSSWIESKQRATAAPLGTTIPEEQRPQTRTDRVNYIDERIRAREQQQR